MRNNKEISKLPFFAPMFDKKLATMVSNFLFLPDTKLTESATLQISGGVAFIGSMLEKIKEKGIKLSQIHKIILNGGIKKSYKKEPLSPETILAWYLTKKAGMKWKHVLRTSEAEIFFETLKLGKDCDNPTEKQPFKTYPKEMPAQQVILDDESTNTKENFTIPRKEGAYNETHELILLTPIIGAVRDKMTALKQLKRTSVKSIGTISYPEQFPFKNPKRREKWTMSREALTRPGITGILARMWIWGEIERIAQYSVKGDILFFNKEHQEQFLKIFTHIRNLTKNRELDNYYKKLFWNQYYRT